MRLLVDTQLLLWAAAEPPKVPAAAAELMNSETSDLHFSVASLWEVTIKNGTNRPGFHVDTRRLRNGLRQAGYGELPIAAEHTLLALPALHRDPFDRMLVAQAAVEGMALLTADATLALYRDHAEIRVV
jgi:PIN domain nuclease of toxin-antitoxin system